MLPVKISTLWNRKGYGPGRSLMERMFWPYLMGSPWTGQQLVWSYLKKTRNMLRGLFGWNPFPFRNNTKKLVKTADVIKTLSFPHSRIARAIFGRTEYFVRFHQRAPLKLVNQRVFHGTALTFGLVGVCTRDETGFPIFAKNQSLDMRRYFDSVRRQIEEREESILSDIKKAENITFGDYISKGCCGAVHKGTICRTGDNETQEVAIKVLYNYETESNSYAIVNSTIKECTPYRGEFGSLQIERKILPAHPNIVKILSVFVDEFKPLKDSEKFYPLALPEAHGGIGHNRTLFVVLKLYDMSLKDYLDCNEPILPRTSLAILTQCFEAIDFLNQNQVSHRDLKLDNILVEMNGDQHDFPWIVLTDFGLCSTSLVVPYESDQVCIGGNRALMAPEIITARPRKNAVLDYRKSDLWSMATIAYEIFGANNPFYRKKSGTENCTGALHSSFYRDEELPPFPSEMTLLPKLISLILRRDPKKRPTVSFVSNYCHLLFQSSSVKMKIMLTLSDQKVVNEMAKEWFQKLTYKTMLEVMDAQGIIKSNSSKMKLMFLAKIDRKQLIHIINQARNIFLE